MMIFIGCWVVGMIAFAIWIGSLYGKSCAYTSAAKKCAACKGLAREISAHVQDSIKQEQSEEGDECSVDVAALRRVVDLGISAEQWQAVHDRLQKQMPGYLGYDYGVWSKDPTILCEYVDLYVNNVLPAEFCVMGMPDSVNVRLAMYMLGVPVFQALRAQYGNAWPHHVGEQVRAAIVNYKTCVHDIRRV